jgi:hypothetical protein
MSLGHWELWHLVNSDLQVVLAQGASSQRLETLPGERPVQQQEATEKRTRNPQLNTPSPMSLVQALVQAPVQTLEPSLTLRLDSVPGYWKLLPKRQRIAIVLPVLSPEIQAKYKVVKEKNSLLPAIKRRRV